MQSGGLLPHRTVVDNIATVPLLSGASRAAARTRAMDLLDRVGLDSSLAHRYPTQLSGGQQQRVGVARALAADPNILLMDEPFGAVDPVVRAELQQGLLQIQADLAKTIVFVTHDVDEAFLLGDEVLVLRRGPRSRSEGAPTTSFFTRLTTSSPLSSVAIAGASIWNGMTTTSPSLTPVVDSWDASPISPQPSRRIREYPMGERKLGPDLAASKPSRGARRHPRNDELTVVGSAGVVGISFPNRQAHSCAGHVDPLCPSISSVVRPFTSRPRHKDP